MSGDATIAEPRRFWDWRPRITPAVELGVLVLAVAIGVATYLVLTANKSAAQLTPLLLALLLMANLIPAVTVLMLLARRFAKRRAAKMLAEGGGQLHVRLVGIFSLLASVPIVLTAFAASIMFQSGGQFWLSDRAQGTFETSVRLVRESRDNILNRWLREGNAMVGDIERERSIHAVGSPEFQSYFVQNAFYRNFKQSALFSYKDGATDVAQFWVSPDLPDQPDALLKTIFSSRVTPKVLAEVHNSGKPFLATSGDTMWFVYEVKGIENAYLYVATTADAQFLTKQATEAQGVIKENGDLLKNGQNLQLKFNLALFGIALLIMAVTAWIALAVADRLVRPLNLLVAAARRAAEGDLGARVPTPEGRDEVATLGNAFNSMTERLQEQTGALESRRALIEAVMSGVSAGVVSIGADGTIRLINASAASLLRTDAVLVVGAPLATVAPELAQAIARDARDSIVEMVAGGEPRTLAVRITADEDGRVLTFDDITQQLLDQRRAAWSDVARRIAHEIKNPLTPIQLAAERLQRRYGKTIDPADTTFNRLTDTIVRQVGDLRQIVDEFSSFARMPKPVFHEESLIDLTRQAVFLQEVSHPNIKFSLDTPDAAPLVCDRRQIGQALTNIVKNAVEAIEARDAGTPGGTVELRLTKDERLLTATIADNGIGLPVERDRIVEPYMTTRARGTGLGLAIVKKIIEEHCGTIAFTDRPGGGTVVTIQFDTIALDALLEHDHPPEETSLGDGALAMLTRTGQKS